MRHSSIMIVFVLHVELNHGSNSKKKKRRLIEWKKYKKANAYLEHIYAT